MSGIETAFGVANLELNPDLLNQLKEVHCLVNYLMVNTKLQVFLCDDSKLCS